MLASARLVASNALRPSGMDSSVGRRSRRRSREEGETSVGVERRITRRASRPSVERIIDGEEEVREGSPGETPRRAQLAARLSSKMSFDAFDSDPAFADAAIRAPSPKDNFFQSPPPRLAEALMVPNEDSRLRRIRRGASPAPAPLNHPGQTSEGPRICNLSEIRATPQASPGPSQHGPGSPSGSNPDGRGSSLRAPSRANSIPVSLTSSFPASVRSTRSAVCAHTAVPPPFHTRRPPLLSLTPPPPFFIHQVETPPSGANAFEAHATLVACPAPRRRPSVLVSCGSYVPTNLGF